ncbi:MAG TPA: helix-turn-helix domain-containing protein [Caldimonas sp.]|nr:helix-turn-helix domain-containing protein [Caldimonas sp.]
MNDSHASPPATARPSLAVSCVRALMERHGLPKYRQSAWLAEAIGLSYAQAHRRMNGTSPWSLEDLAQVAGLFGESLVDLVSLGLPQSSVPAVMNVGGARVACQLWLGETLDKPVPGSVVAVKTSEGWAAVPATEATEGVIYKIERIEARPVGLAKKVIAVLDDDQDLTNSICAHFQASGYDARPFYRTADLLSATASQRFDAYVIDWIVGEKSTVRLIGSLRGQDATCPIVVLTAQVLSGVVDEADIADAVQRYGLVFNEKPVRTSILAATLTRALAGSES